MILTGKAKEDFLKQYGNEEWEIDDIYLHALIIEFFDSVGITVDVMPILNNPIKWMPNPFWIEKEISTDDSECYKTRKEATIEAIKKANEIYNAN